MTKDSDRNLSAVNKPNIKLIDNFILNSDLLCDRLKNNVVWDERLKQRKTASYGVAYNYSGITYPDTPMPEELISICHKINSTVGFMPNNCLLNYYPDGNSTMWYHSDTAQELVEGTGVAIVSLGAARFISYRSKREPSIKYRYRLNNVSSG